MIVNFAAQTVQGFGMPLKITAADELTVEFGDQQEIGPSVMQSMHGSIDRVTGDVEATHAFFDSKTRKPISITAFALQCRPTQRMF